MSRSPIHRFTCAVAVALLLAACAPQEPERQSLPDLLADAQEANAAAAHGHDHSTHDHGGEAAEAADSSVMAPADDPGDTDREPAEPAASEPPAEPPGDPSPMPGSPGSEQPSAEAAGPTMEQYDDFPITVTLSSTCVEQGGELTVLVDAGRKHTGVVYIAIYHGEESGAPPPYGDGHGGNSGDMTDDDGFYEDTWVVSPDAPVGPARVEVMAGRDGEKSTDLVRFEVLASGNQGC